MKTTCICLVAFAFAASLVGSPPAAAQSPSSGKLPSAETMPESEYRLGPGDKLRVEVYKDAQLSQSLEVRPDGRITLPLVGDVVASGFTPIELRDRLATALAEYITNPIVTVIVVEANAPMVYVIGEVNQPGSIPMRAPMTVLQALAMAGGFREWANPKNIRILRGKGDASRVETIGFNYKEAVKGTTALTYLRPGDLIVVP